MTDREAIFFIHCMGIDPCMTLAGRLANRVSDPTVDAFVVSLAAVLETMDALGQFRTNGELIDFSERSLQVGAAKFEKLLAANQKTADEALALVKGALP